MTRSARLRGLDESRDVIRIVREIGVHLQHPVRAELDGAPETRDAGQAAPPILRAMQQMYPRIGGRAFPDDTPGAVRRIVVDDQRLPFRSLRENRVEQRPDVLGLIVGRQHGHESRHGSPRRS
jgi:hypothetical protein